MKKYWNWTTARATTRERERSFCYGYRTEYFILEGYISLVTIYFYTCMYKYFLSFKNVE